MMVSAPKIMAQDGPSMAEAAVFECRSASVTLGSRQALRLIIEDISFKLRRSEFLTIVGHSGTGKTTLLRMIAGLESVTGGDIEESVTGAFFLEENAHRAYLSCTLGKPKWIDPEVASDAAAELIRTRGPMRRVWAMVDIEGVE